MKTAIELFNWYFSIHEKTDKKGAQPYRLDAADLAICLKEHDKELEATNDSRTRGTICVHCGEHIMHTKEMPIETVHKIMLEHELNCDKNPLVIENRKLKEQ